MKEACTHFLGEHDFTSFCASNTDVKSKVRKILNIDIISVDENLYKLSITGNGFLYNMVRIIMGTLVCVGFNKIDPKDIISIINSKHRDNAGKTMPSKGLYLKKVIY
jgi:tRNA pseudouridine38-40 synthase